MKKKLLTLLLSLAMAVTMMPMTAVGSFAAAASPFTKAQLEEPFYIEATTADGATVSFKHDNRRLAVNLLYKINNEEWQDYDLNKELKLSQSDKVYFKAGSESNSNLKNSKMDGYFGQNSFHTTGKAAIGGNIMSLLDGQAFSTKDKFEEGIDSQFEYLFYEGGDFVSANDLVLPAMQLSPRCYSGMFFYCGLLEEAPKLPATKLAAYCYESMFRDCILLKKSPDLPATELEKGCYEALFFWCTGLEEASELPAKVMKTDCYSVMFDTCTSLKKAPELPSTQLASGCYAGMFRGCANLEKTPELPAKILKHACYAEMFSGCNQIKEAPKLPATQLTTRCYDSMFAGCSSLQSAPELPAKELKGECYNFMFSGCSSLKEAPELPAKTVANRCYKGMFYACTGLTQAPELPSTNLSYECYAEMFSQCTNLRKAPVLPAQKTTTFSYQMMFEGCESLNRIEVGFEEWNPFATPLWLSGVAEKGTFVCKKELAEKMQRESFKNDLIPESTVPEGWTVCTDYFNRDELVDRIYENSSFIQRVNDVLSKTKLFVKDLRNKLSVTFDSGFGFLLPKDEIPFYIEAVEDNTQVKLCKEMWGEPFEVYLLCKVNNGKWQSISFDDDEVVLPTAGDRVYFKAGTEDDESVTNDYFASYVSGGVTGIVNYNHRFSVIKGSAELGGNIMSLLDGKNFSTKVAFDKGTEATFANLFAYSENIVSAEKLILPATELVQACYAQMFYNCVDLKKAPKLNAKAMQRCCYSGMFQGCTSLEKAPELSAKYLAESCYASMFRDCSSLKEAPKLPAQELCSGCYHWMFTNCASIETIELPAAEPKYFIYDYMFQGCKSLKTIKLGLKMWDEEALGWWLMDANEKGTIICTPEFVESINEEIEKMDFYYDYSTIPEGWKLVPEYQDESTLKDSIYTILSFPARMFNIVQTAGLVMEKVKALSILDVLGLFDLKLPDKAELL